MGNCLIKKNVCASSSSPVSKITSETQPEKEKAEEETLIKEEIIIIKNRKSHEIEEEKDKEIATAKIIESTNNNNPINVNGIIGGGGVMSSSCTKEELDAILIQCGRLSRSSSIQKSGAKRSYDFDKDGKNVVDVDEDVENGEERGKRHRERQRSKSKGRRRTPSREKEQQRSGSRERGSGRRVSRSPGRRSESPITSSNSNSNANGNNLRPGKLVSVPATVSSFAIDKSSDGCVGELNSLVAGKRNQVKRNDRTIASPRTRSPARVRGASNENQNVKSQIVPTLSRTNSRKAEHSPCRRNPLSEIDTNIISQAAPIQKPNSDNHTMQVSHCKTNVGLNVISSAPENPKPNTHTRTRSSRLSRDLDNINPETLSNPNNTSSYAALLLEDIQNFHQKKNTTSCSILEAVADLDSSITEHMNKNITAAKIKSSSQETKGEPFLESEIIVGNDDLMEPSFHKYVTTIRSEEELEEQESSGSNSVVGWEHNSAESNEPFSTTNTTTTSRLDCGKRLSAKKRNCDNRQTGIGRGRIGPRGTQMTHVTATTT
ncbi:hypothetical protein RD792_013092 [Penstemon davidsonii]|uniref:Uncharacterized protein n=1 Tax=Penstemon davidsonii TaxID=160366 RepID=A0ABR0CT22_9LAMI|nr:hypothetical protein RD792_013092 [Penstemon davidsonii]